MPEENTPRPDKGATMTITGRQIRSLVAAGSRPIMSMYGWSGCSAFLAKAEVSVPVLPIPTNGCKHIEESLEGADPQPMIAEDVHTDTGRAYVKIDGSWFDAAPVAFFQPDQVAVVAPSGRVTLVGYRQGKAIFLLGEASSDASWPAGPS